MAKSLRAKITASAVTNLPPGFVLFDPELTGFGVRRQAGGCVYFVRKRLKGQNRMPWITIGTHGDIGPNGKPWTHKTARDQAIRLLGEIASGNDPSAKRDAAKTNPTIQDAASDFMAQHGPKLKPRTREEYQRLVNNDIIPTLGKHKLKDIKRGHVMKFHADLASTPRKANFALAVLSKMMTWAEDAEYRAEQSNPCRGITKFKEVKRERYLTKEEFVRLGKALASAESAGTVSVYAAAAIRLYIFLGARRNEILTLKWSFVDFERRALRLPDSKTDEKLIRLNAAAIAVLEAVPRLEANPYVIAGRHKGRHLVNIKDPWNIIRNAADIPEVRLHDLRHSFASVVASAPGSSLIQLGALLGHTDPKTTARYAHLFDDPTRQTNENAGEHIGAVLNSAIT